MMTQIKMIVVCTNSNGEGDFFPCKVNLAEKYYLDGEHYALAEVEAGKRGYEEPWIACDENEPLFKPFAASVNWNEVPCLTNKP